MEPFIDHTRIEKIAKQDEILRMGALVTAIVISVAIVAALAYFMIISHGTFGVWAFTAIIAAVVAYMWWVNV